jgi:hypothetical protein
MDTPPKPDPVAEFEAELLAGLECEDDFAVRELLAAGSPVYYLEEDTPKGLVVKEHPDGRRQLVRGAGANEQVVRDL